ncbi:MAG: SusD/RagB family nutrient-binding outer membrane lipoprotein [Bacteroidetes bacterium]|nr:MAG: SusD/RagB family nutrient-binding outer membrane lipoprotein [Bacteroidota bacterium]
MRKLKIYIVLVLATTLYASCDKGFEELNKNPFQSTETDIGPLFNTCVNSLRMGWSEQLYLYNETLYEITQQAALSANTFQNVSIGSEDIWNNYYITLAHIRELESRFDAWEGDQEALNNARAMLKIMLAYKTFKLTDLFGDMPFFEAGRGFEDLNYARPKFDSQEDIYVFMLEELKWSVENINTTPNPVTGSGENYYDLGNFETLFNGDMALWVKFANSLRLRHAVRMYEKAPQIAGSIIAEILENDLPLIKDFEDNALMMPRQQQWLNLSVGWSFREHKKLRMGSNIWDQFSENDNLDGSGIFDPRCFVFFETNNANEWAPFPQIPDEDTPQSGGIPYQYHRDDNYPIKGQDNIYSPFNYYLIRDEQDVPEILITAAEVHYLLAEIYIRGMGVPADESTADGEYTLGLAESIAFWQQVAHGSEIWTNAQTPLSSGEIFAVTNHPKLSIFESTDKLNLVYAQRWVDAFRQPWEAYALIRRTGGQTPHEGTIKTHYRFAYPPGEVENNPDNWADQVARMGEDSHLTKIWWMP